MGAKHQSERYTRILYIVICFLSLSYLNLFITVDYGVTGEKLVVASVPWQKESTLRTTYQPLIDLLQRKTSKDVSLVVSESYKEVSERLMRGSVDIAILGGNGYVETKLRNPKITYIATCKQPSAFYNSLIITTKNSSIKELGDLLGKSFGYTDRESTSGFIYPRLMLNQAGLDPEILFKKAYFLNKHCKVYDAVARGVIDAGGVSSTLYEKAVARNGDIYRIISESAPIPRNAIVASAHLSREDVDLIKSILKDAENDSDFHSSNSILKGFLIKDDSFYDIVRQVRLLQ